MINQAALDAVMAQRAAVEADPHRTNPVLVETLLQWLDDAGFEVLPKLVPPRDGSHLDLQEFRDGGYLQEANRKFFHPLGLAMEVYVEDGRVVRLGGIWDFRHDPEGMCYGDDQLSEVKARKVEHERVAKSWVRKERLGYVVQPVPEAGPWLAAGDAEFVAPSDDPVEGDVEGGPRD